MTVGKREGKKTKEHKERTNSSRFIGPNEAYKGQGMCVYGEKIMKLIKLILITSKNCRM